MIELFTGTPGSGKSLHTASIIKAWLRLDRPVLCNFAVKPGCVKNQSKRFHYIPNEKLTPDGLIEISKAYWAEKKTRIKEDTILLVIDEAQLLFNARAWNQKGRDAWLSFFTQHRKFGYRVILVAQFDGMIDKQIRSLVEYQQIHRKVSNFGWMGKIMAALCCGKLFVAVKIWYPLNERLDSQFFMATKRLYGIYDTFCVLDEEPEEEKPNDTEKESQAAPS